MHHDIQGRRPLEESRRWTRRRPARALSLLRGGLLGLFLLAPTSCAEFSAVDFAEVLAAGGGAGLPLDQATVTRGLKQALDVGTRRTTATLSARGGFGRNPVLRLRLPGELGTMAQGLRTIGFGAQVDALEDSMNRAAEEAAGRAVPVFASAIGSMTVADAFEILRGPEDAATRYFQDRTSAALRRQFQPIAASAMQQTGLYDAYRQLVAQYETIPFAKPPALNLEQYVTDQTLSALFGEIAKEEALIRRDPAARSTALLRRVFGTPQSQQTSSGY